MSQTPIKITTVDRILDASLKLFNEQGFNCVPAMRIATHLGISPGHLAYHFKNKSDILLALFPRMEKAMEEYIDLEVAHASPASIERPLKVLKTLWNYRFFFIELPQIAPLDPKILESFLKLEDHAIQSMCRSYDRRTAEGAMQVLPPPNSTEVLARTVWSIWLDWIRREQLRHPGQQTPSGTSVYEVMMRSYCISQPYFHDNYLDEISVILAKRLLPDATAAKNNVSLTSTDNAAPRRRQSAG